MSEESFVDFIQSVKSQSYELLLNQGYQKENVQFRKSESKKVSKYFVYIGSKDPVYPASFQKIADIELAPNDIIRIGYPHELQIQPPDGMSPLLRDPDFFYTLDFFPLSINSALSFLFSLFDISLISYTPSNRFGCCSQYAACSAQGTCLHSNKLYAQGCWYRQSLLKGNCFLAKK